MQKSMCLVLFVALFTSSCTTIVFEKPIPLKATVIDKCPTTLVGQFVEEESTKPHLLREVISFESPNTNQLSVYQYKQFDTEDLKNFPTFEIKNNVLIEHIKVTVKDSEITKDSTNETPVLRTKTGYQTAKQLAYGLDFKTKTITQYPEPKETDEKVGKFEMRKQGETYYLNVKGLVTEDYWYVVLLTPTAQQLTINMLSQFDDANEEDVNSIMPLTKLDDDTYLAKPAETQLEAFLKYPEVGEVSFYKRIKR